MDRTSLTLDLEGNRYPYTPIRVHRSLRPTIRILSSPQKQNSYRKLFCSNSFLVDDSAENFVSRYHAIPTLIDIEALSCQPSSSSHLFLRPLSVVFPTFGNPTAFENFINLWQHYVKWTEPAEGSQNYDYTVDSILYRVGNIEPTVSDPFLGIPFRQNPEAHTDMFRFAFFFRVLGMYIDLLGGTEKVSAEAYLSKAALFFGSHSLAEEPFKRIELRGFPLYVSPDLYRIMREFQTDRTDDSYDCSHLKYFDR